MATPTTNQGIPVPDPTDADNVPYAISQAVATIEPRLVMRFTTATARDTILTAPVEGMTAYLSTPDLLTVYAAGAWRSVPIPMGGGDVAGAPYAVASGQITVSGTAVASTGNVSTAVTFPTSRFSVAPRVIVGISNSVSGSTTIVPRAASITSTGCSILAVNAGASAATWTALTIDWYAVQMTNAAASG